MIATKLHMLEELGVDDPLLGRMMAAPKYAIAPQLVAILSRPDVQTSIWAMIEAGIARLPYAPLLIEFSVWPTVHRFVLLDEADGGFTLRDIVLVENRAAVVSPSEIRVGIAPGAITVDRHADESEGLAAALAVSIALLMLNIRGVDKQVIEASALSRARQKRGKPAIPSHTLLRVGTIYDRSGRGVAAGSGRHMPVHLRAGHVRQQPCGPASADRKPVFIPPVLVNYREGGAEPRTPQRLVTV